MTRTYDDLTPEAQADRDTFELDYGTGNCSCHISAPCGSCTHVGNPLNQENDPDAWLPTVPPEERSHAWLLERYKEDTDAITKLSIELNHLKKVHHSDLNRFADLQREHVKLRASHDAFSTLSAQLQSSLAEANEKLLVVEANDPSRLPNPEGVLMPKGLVHKHMGTSDAAFFELIDKCGGWPVGYKYVGFEHTDERKAGFSNSPFNTGYWTTLFNVDDYYMWKLSPAAMKRIVMAVKDRIAVNIQRAAFSVDNLHIDNSRGHMATLSEDKK